MFEVATQLGPVVVTCAGDSLEYHFLRDTARRPGGSLYTNEIQAVVQSARLIERKIRGSRSSAPKCSFSSYKCRLCRVTPPVTGVSLSPVGRRKYKCEHEQHTGFLLCFKITTFFWVPCFDHLTIHSIFIFVSMQR